MTEPAAVTPNVTPAPIKLHIGGEEVREGWSILNIKPGPSVAYVGTCTDLSALPDNSCSEVYASHVLEHLGYDGELQKALKEIFRVLQPRGRLRLSVPDLEILCKLFVHPQLDPGQKFLVMRMIYGGRTDAYDVHYSGLTLDIMSAFLATCGFRDIRRVREFNLFKDTSTLRMGGQVISLNMEATKPG
jgi:predicted SAM-dependent methyltransferase